MTTKKAFEFADLLADLFRLDSENNSINHALLKYLGRRNYLKFCDNIKTATVYQRKITRPKYFSKKFHENIPDDSKLILSDKTIKEQWLKSVFMEKVMELL